MNTKKVIAALVSLLAGAPTPIRWGGSGGSYTAEGAIRLPEPVARDSEEEFLLLTRLAAHEVGHRRHTDLGWELRLEEAEVIYFNLLEDARQEREMGKTFPGARLILDRGAKPLIEKVIEHLANWPEEESGRDLYMQAALFTRTSLLMHGGAYLLPHAKAIHAAHDRLPGPIRAAFEDATSALLAATSSRDSERIAIDLVARLSSGQPEPQQGGEQSQSTPEGGQGQPGQQGGEQSQSTPEGGQGQPGQQGGRRSMGDVGEILRQMHADKFGAPAGDQAAEADDSVPVSQHAIDRLRAMIENGEVADFDGLIAAVQAGTNGSDGLGLQGGSGASDHLGAPIGLAANPVDARLSGVDGQLVRALNRMLTDLRRRPAGAAMAGIRVLPNRLWRLRRLGDTRVFRSKPPRLGVDAAVTVLLDRSASMRDTIGEAGQAALALGMALRRVGNTRTSVRLFPPSERIGADVLVDFGQGMNGRAELLKGLKAFGGTPMGPAIDACVDDLKGMKQAKKVILLITDGKPGYREAAVQALRNASDAGVAVFGIGIAKDLDELIPNSARIETVEDLPKAIEKLLTTQGGIAEALYA